MNKLIDTIVQFFKEINSTAQLVLIGLVVFTIAYSFGSCGKKTELDEYNKKYKEYQEQVAIALKRGDSLEKVVKIRSDSAVKDSIDAAKQTNKINNLKNSLNSTQSEKTRLQHEIDSLKNVTVDTSAISLKKDTVITVLRTDSATMKATIDALEKRDTLRLSEIAKHKQNVLDATSRADSLNNRLRLLPDAPKDPDKWLFGLMKKPSRVQVGVVSLTVGVIAGILLVK